MANKSDIPIVQDDAQYSISESSHELEFQLRKEKIKEIIEILKQYEKKLWMAFPCRNIDVGRHDSGLSFKSVFIGPSENEVPDIFIGPGEYHTPDIFIGND